MELALPMRTTPAVPVSTTPHKMSTGLVSAIQAIPWQRGPEWTDHTARERSAITVCEPALQIILQRQTSSTENEALPLGKPGYENGTLR